MQLPVQHWPIWGFSFLVKGSRSDDLMILEYQVHYQSNQAHLAHFAFLMPILLNLLRYILRNSQLAIQHHCDHEIPVLTSSQRAASAVAHMYLLPTHENFLIKAHCCLVSGFWLLVSFQLVIGILQHFSIVLVNYESRSSVNSQLQEPHISFSQFQSYSQIQKLEVQNQKQKSM